MLQAAADVTRDLNVANAGDLLGGPAGIGAARLCGAGRRMSCFRWPLSLVSALIAVLALYRAGSFIHELTHIKTGAVPGFRLAWNLLVGDPAAGALLPLRRRPQPASRQTLLRDRQRSRISAAGADEALDPAAVPARRRACAGGAAGPLRAARAAVDAVDPAARLGWSAAIRAFRSTRSSAARGREGEFARHWALAGNRRQHLGDRAARRWPRRASSRCATSLILLGIASGVMFLNQVRTLVAHLWENDGEPMSVTAQYLDSVNVPPPATLPALWAPVGLRYHALHHLLPGCPITLWARRTGGCARSWKRIRPTIGKPSAIDEAGSPACGEHGRAGPNRLCSRHAWPQTGCALSPK